MSRPAPTPAGAYARAIEEHWSRTVERPVVLSPRDWTLVSDWHARGIPLQIVRDALSAAAGRSRRSSGGAPRRLAYIAPAVEEAWSVVVEGRLSGRPAEAPSGVGAGPTGADWRRRIAQEPPGSALGRLLESLARQLDEGHDPESVDRQLDEALPGVAPPALRQAAERDVATRLESYRSRMQPDRLEATRGRAVAALLRRRLGLPRLESRG